MRRRGAGLLTPRQLEVARLVADGLTDAQIARRLTIAEGTVGVHLADIMARLHVHNRVGVARWAWQRAAPCARHGGLLAERDALAAKVHAARAALA